MESNICVTVSLVLYGRRGKERMQIVHFFINVSMLQLFIYSESFNILIACIVIIISIFIYSINKKK